MNARLILARAVTVAIRYLSIRRQFRNKDNPDESLAETAVLDYSTVQIRVLTLLATAFALHYGGSAMRELYERTRKTNALDGDKAQLAELHSTSAGLKSLATDLAANGIETCRRSMGGHGFGGGTGLVQLNADYLSKPTVEGDNWMITQQAAKYLISKVGEALGPASATSQSKTEASLREYAARRNQAKPLGSLDSDSAIAQAFEWRVSHFAFQAYEAREVQKRSWNSLLIDLYKLSVAYSQSMLVTSFFEGVEASNISIDTRSVLADLYRLYALHTMDTEAREFQASGAVSAEVLNSLRPRILELMARIRPHAVKLVDSFAIPDYLLDSALGSYDGKVYENLFHRAHRLNPLNRITFNPDYRTDEIVMGSGDGGSILAKL
jgi:acyl-CoA oxidase